MTNSILTRFVALSALLVLCPAKGPAKEYVLTVANEQLRFVPQGEKGYVVKQPQYTAGISALAGTLFLEEGRVQPIGGLDRHGVWIVENDGPASKNDAVMAELSRSGAAEYIAPLFSSNGETVAVIPEIVVRVKPGTAIEQVRQLCETAGCAMKKRMEFTTQEYLLQVLGPDAEAVFTALSNLSKIEWVEWAAPNTAFQPKLLSKAVPGGSDSGEQLRLTSAGQGANGPGVFPNDEYFPMQWHLHNTGQSGGTPGADIRAQEAWEITTGDPNIVIAMFDCGVDTKHPDLINNLMTGRDFYDRDDNVYPALDHPVNAHGTNCAGLLAAQGNNEIGLSGVTWNCKILPVRVGGIRANRTQYAITLADAAAAIRWAAVEGADILSTSWDWGQTNDVWRSAIAEVTESGGLGRNGRGCLFFTAAGNTSAGILPQAVYPEVIAVGGTDHNDIRCSYSSYGPQLDIVAPTAWQWTSKDWADSKSSGALWTTDISGPPGWNFDLDPSVLDYTSFNGTSGSCPIAAGVAALILSIEPNLTGDEVRHFLERSAKDLGAPGRDDYYGWGRVDARAALDMVLAKRADLNNDWKVDFSDFAVFAQCWKTDDLRGDIGPIPRPDGVLDVQDLALMGEYWLKEIPELGLIAHWKLDETGGGIAHNSIKGKDSFGPPDLLWRPKDGKVGGALELDGLDDCLFTSFSLDPAEGPFSVFAWVKGGAPGQVVISQTGPGGASWLSTDPYNGWLITELKDPGRLGIALCSEAVITDGDWHHVGLTWDGSNRILYVDDAEAAKDTQAALGSSKGGLYFGAGKDRQAGSFFSGLIDDVRIYDRAVQP